MNLAAVVVDSSMPEICMALSEKHKKRIRRSLMKKIKTISINVYRTDLIESYLRVIKSSSTGSKRN